MARLATSMSMRASSPSVSTRIGLAMRCARSTPSECAISTFASTRPMASVASSSAAFTVYMSGVLAQARQLLGLVLRGERAGDLVQIAAHDLVDLVQGEVDAMVGHAALREVVRADAIAAVARAHEALPLRGFLRLLLAH